MRGLDVSEAFYNEYGRPMIEGEFADVADRIAVGLVGEGSECLGYDDHISRDHDFDAGFCIFLTAEDEERFGFRLARAYSRLPKEYMGLRRSLISPVGGDRHGVIIIEDFYRKFLGSPTAPESLLHWLSLPSHSLLSASNGRVFYDGLGVFSRTRDILLRGYPEDVRLKKLSAHTAAMAQSGQYNYSRLMKRGERGSAQLAIYEFVRHAISAVYLLNRRYEPFYKWAYRGLRELPILSELAETLAALSETDNSEELVKLKCEIIEDVAAMLISKYREQGISSSESDDLERHAASIADNIADPNLRNMYLLEGI